MTTRYIHLFRVTLLGTALLGLALPVWAAPLKFEDCRIFIEYNSSDNDLGFHVFLDAEEWNSVQIVNPDGVTIFAVQGRGPYGDLGLSELFTEGAEPTLDEFPLGGLLDLFPQGQYQFLGTTPEGESLTACKAQLSHTVPAGPMVSPVVDGDGLKICWDPVTEVATNPAAEAAEDEFPEGSVDVVAYQVILAESFQVTVPAASPPAPMCVTVPPEFPAKKGDGYEVLAIEKSGNQTITEGFLASTP